MFRKILFLSIGILSFSISPIFFFLKSVFDQPTIEICNQVIINIFNDIDSKKENKNKQCCNTKNLTCSELNCEEEKKGGLKEEEKKV